MSQCLRCSKPCEATAVFCEACRSLLRSQLWQDAYTLPETSSMTPPIVAMSPESGDPLERITSPYPVVQASLPPVTPSPPFRPSSSPSQPQTVLESVPGGYSHSYVADQAIHKLNEAAQRIAEIEPSHRRMPRASRL